MMKLFNIVSSLLLMLASSTTSSNALEIGDHLCVQGYVMDYYCIDKVNMIDNGLPTLEQPGQRTVHCLVDVSLCYTTPFEILTDPVDGSDYTRGYRLTEASKQPIIELARSVGSCSTCVKGYDSSMLGRGFRAVVNATVVELSNGDVPPTIAVHQMAYDTSNDPCMAVFGLTEGEVNGNSADITGILATDGIAEVVSADGVH